MQYSGVWVAISGEGGEEKWCLYASWAMINDHSFNRWSFNLTLFITGVFGLAAGGSPDFITLASLLAMVGTGVGGNMPVDSAVFLGKVPPFLVTRSTSTYRASDLVPASHQYLLTVMAVWWSLGQLVVSLVRFIYN